jgi:hypothetical protein
MHVMGPPSAAGSAFNTVGIICFDTIRGISVLGTWRRRGIPGYCDLSHLQPACGGRQDSDGKMKPLGGGSVRRVAIGRCTPNPGCQPRQGRKSKGRRTTPLTVSVREHRVEAKVAGVDGKRIPWSHA